MRDRRQEGRGKRGGAGLLRRGLLATTEGETEGRNWIASS